ncbi:CYTH and CHAD domain-containing protein [Corynebacterium minutissimum]|uniref:CYTH and CHAD domain-containing protein n=1 Tax=Corynebacterium minutissimum TaxID=38301 RepID=A0A2X4RSL2_9CORY|nr:CYTH and CHAD domain-containing protein [Corynebacterium minutissimum]KHO29193.1 metal-chelation protein CHAD [Corynebacterium minutissimum]QPS59347.1 CYTH and CHAD domain-containing protein [Corynebacterium minutissimum]QQA79864.1 CYTH and CHAD domain-containing protein [Corynebacterium minutissimum]SQH99300.1 putative pyridoxine biosynthesis enzyme [Corynebacterium minutissimum]VEG06475.1 putative pyridoxine biosynthesis enzyme [Corynebacterium minutissimum]
MSPKTFLEVEAKFAVDESTPVPDLTQLEEVARVAETRHHSMSAIYYDTEDLRLTHAKITLRRRTGGNDDGWHIKIPGDAGRTEIRAEMGEPVDGRYEVPAELIHEVRSVIRNHPLAPIAQVDNNRTELLLVDEADQPIAEFCDDHVTGFSFLPDGTQCAWREWEVELAGELPATKKGGALLRHATSLLISSGARVSSSPSKLKSALGDSINNVELPPALAVSNLDPDSPAAAVVNALKANRDKLVEYDPRVRRDEWDSVHQMRVATRELRSHLQTFHGIVVGPEIERLESDLKQLASMLGVARDAEVVEERWQSLLASEDSDVLDAATREHIAHDMGRDYRRAHRRVIAALDSDQYLDLLDALDAFLANPPVAGEDTELEGDATDSDAESAASESAEEIESPEKQEQPKESKPKHAKSEDAEHHDLDTVMALHLNQAYDKLVKRHKKAVKNWDNTELTLHEREEYFHDMRKAAKKLRYAAEAAGSATNLKTKNLYKACKNMQSVLGDFQDSVTSRDKLIELAETARRRGEDTFGYGLLYQRERAIGLEALDAYAESFKAIKSAFKPLRKKLEK